jgi:hypothetical protein
MGHVKSGTKIINIPTEYVVTGVSLKVTPEKFNIGKSALN